MAEDQDDFTEAKKWELAAKMVSDLLTDLDYLSVCELGHEEVKEHPRYVAMPDDERDELWREVHDKAGGLAEELKKALQDFVAQQKAQSQEG